MSSEQHSDEVVAAPPSAEPVIDGTCADAYLGVREAFAENFANGLEVGASVCVMVDGEPVVDLWGGVTEVGGAPWQRDSVTTVQGAGRAGQIRCDPTRRVGRWSPFASAVGSARRSTSPSPRPLIRLRVRISDG